MLGKTTAQWLGEPRDRGVVANSEFLQQLHESDRLRSWAKSAAEDQDVGAGERDFGGLNEMFAVVAYDGLEFNFDTKSVELRRQVKRIRILAVRSKQLEPTAIISAITIAV